MEPPESLGKLVKKWRLDSGLTTQGLADRINLVREGAATYQKIQQLEGAGARRPSRRLFCVWQLGVFT